LTDALVVGRDVRIEYPGGVRAVERATFEIRRGEIAAIIGPSGCGKTTLLKAIAGLLPIAAGSLTLEGAPIREPGPDRAVVFQEFDQLFAWRTVRDNVVFALRVARRLTIHDARARADAMLELVGIAQAANAYPHQLSGGMKQRAAIARALALAPRILLMDEPFGSLDAITRGRLQLDLEALWRQTGVTIVLVTHSIEEAIFLGSRVLVMSAGPAVIREVVDTGAAQNPADPSFAALRTHLRSLLIARSE
jgi:NitT/TauT family transport system ATP-binding protein